MSSSTLITALYVFVLAAFLGYQVISRVPPLLHTPLMSATNAISGISLVGSIVIAGSGHGTVATILGFIAVVCSTTNVVGGFVITDRMLRMFKRKDAPKTSLASPHYRWVATFEVSTASGTDLSPSAIQNALANLLHRIQLPAGVDSFHPR